MEVTEVSIGDIRMRFRLRTPKESKIEEIAASIKQLGLLNPITITKDYYLIAGFHRLHACKLLNYKTIPAVIKDTTKVYGELMEIDENLKRNELNHIEIAEHMVRREELLEELGVRMKKGGNQYTNGNMVTTNELAEEVGLSNRVYRLKRQPATINEEARDLLRDTKWAENLMDMVKLSQQEQELQMKIANALVSGKYGTFKRAFVDTSINDYNATRTKVVDFDLKERWGVPQSIMQFKKADVELQMVCNKVSKDPELEWTKRGIHFDTSTIPVYQMAADHAEFLVTYYTPEGGIILDNFMGRGTIGLASLWHGRKFIGYDVEKKNVDRMQEVVDQTFPKTKADCTLYHSDGVLLKELEDESNFLDAVVTDPPYVLQAEKYTTDERDISGLSHEDYMKAIKLNFLQLHRLIKQSDFDKKVFHPVIFKVGTGRRGKMGIIDMDADFQQVAKECGFVLWDKLYNKLVSPFAATNWERNYNNKYVHKNYETNLVFCRFQ